METRRLQTDPVTKNSRLEIVNTEQVKRVLDEGALIKKKAYLENSILNFQNELTVVNQQIDEITQAKK